METLALSVKHLYQRARTLSIILVLLMLCSDATANRTTDNSERQQMCSAWENIARAAMTSRQAGVPLSTMLQLVSDETAMGIFNAAYEQPIEGHSIDQKASVSRFVEFVLFECLKS